MKHMHAIRRLARENTDLRRKLEDRDSLHERHMLVRAVYRILGHKAIEERMDEMLLESLRKDSRFCRMEDADPPKPQNPRQLRTN